LPHQATLPSAAARRRRPTSEKASPADLCSQLCCHEHPSIRQFPEPSTFASGPPLPVPPFDPTLVGASDEHCPPWLRLAASGIPEPEQSHGWRRASRYDRRPRSPFREALSSTHAGHFLPTCASRLDHGSLLSLGRRRKLACSTSLAEISFHIRRANAAAFRDPRYLPSMSPVLARRPLARPASSLEPPPIPRLSHLGPASDTHSLPGWIP
jgi:hypothetical protein